MEKLTEDKAKILLELRQQGISDPIIMEAVEKINHNIFSPEPFVNVIENKSINSENEQYPAHRAFAIGIIISNLNLCRQSRILEISPYSGLQTCILAHICRRVYSLCMDKENKQDLQNILDILQIKNVTLNILEKLEKGWEIQAPFDAIIINEPIISVPETLKNQLKIGGNLIAPVDFDDIESKNLIKITKINENEFTYTKISPLIKFVML